MNVQFHQAKIHAFGRRSRRQFAENGAYSVEFAMVIVIFLTVIFGIIEVARAMYVINTLQEVTRRGASAAANVDFRNEAAKDAVRQRAIFRDSPGELILGKPITDAHLRIDYLAMVRDAGGGLTLTPIPSGAMPTCPSRNRLTCLADPNSPSCISFVRVRVCEPGNADDCQPVQYSPIVPLVNLPINLPRSTTIARVETLGYQTGMTPCP